MTFFVFIYFYLSNYARPYQSLFGQYAEFQMYVNLRIKTRGEILQKRSCSAIFRVAFLFPGPMARKLVTRSYNPLSKTTSAYATSFAITCFVYLNRGKVLYLISLRKNTDIRKHMYAHLGSL